VSAGVGSLPPTCVLLCVSCGGATPAVCQHVVQLLPRTVTRPGTHQAERVHAALPRRQEEGLPVLAVRVLRRVHGEERQLHHQKDGQRAEQQIAQGVSVAVRALGAHHAADAVHTSAIIISTVRKLGSRYATLACARACMCVCSLHRTKHGSVPRPRTRDPATSNVAPAPQKTSNRNSLSAAQLFASRAGWRRLTGGSRGRRTVRSAHRRERGG
jgi:hypothetical protein